MKSEVHSELVKIHFEPGDILVVDADLVDIEVLSRTPIPGLNFLLPIIPVTHTYDGDGVESAIRSVDLATLKRIVGEMEATVEAPR